jgi:hypothetical protein
MENKREEKALLEFKHAVDDIMQLLRKSTEADTVYMYWVNRTRQQFVLETSATILPNVMFRDRLSFDSHFLNSYKEIQQPVQLKVDEDVDPKDLTHYHDMVPVRFLTLVPFINNGETVAVTVIETEFQLNLTDYEDVLSSYRNALTNILNTYLELTDLYENQKEWVQYGRSLDRITPRMHRTDILNTMIEEMETILPGGGAVLIARGMESWVTVMRAGAAQGAPALGLNVEEKSLAYDALHKGAPVFAIHFNQNPKRISNRETSTSGASYAIPLLINDRRHAVVLAHHSNPLIFTEANKHKLNNLVRMAQMAIHVNLDKLSADQDILTSEYGNFIPDVWEKTLIKQIERAGESDEKTWFGFFTIGNLQEIRSRLRLEDLKRLQRTLVNQLNPSRYDFNGFIGFNTDYTYSFIFTSDHEESLHKWFRTLYRRFEEPVELVEGKRVEISLKHGTVAVNEEAGDLHQVISDAKKRLSESVKGDNMKSAINY